MRTRAISSVAVVVVGLLPALLGGPVFEAVMAALGVVGYREFLALTARITPVTHVPRTGYAVIVALALAALVDPESGIFLFTVVAGATSVPLAVALAKQESTAPFVGWGLAATGSLYLGLPIYAAVALRGTGGDVASRWLERLASAAALGWAPAPRGLAWLLIVIFSTWLGDTFAYLVGRRWGRRPLLLRVSPKKTVEGSIGGLVGSSLAGGIGATLFGLGISAWIGVGVGLALGLVGQLGDLGESLLKRQAGVKDSGSLIPGHGGVLDRIDALLFALAVAWPLVALIDRFGH